VTAPDVVPDVTLSYDHTSVVSDQVEVPYPNTVEQIDNGDGTFTAEVTITVPDGDYGVVLVAFTAETDTVLTDIAIVLNGFDPDGTPTQTDAGWATLLPPTVANRVGMAVFGKNFDAANDGQSFSLALGDPRQVMVVGVWYPGIDGPDVTGPVGLNPPATSEFVTAPPITTSAVAGDQLLSLFVTGIQAAPPDQVDVDNAVLQVQQSGVPNSMWAGIADATQTGMGLTDPVTASYSPGNTSGLGVQIGLLPTGALLGFPVTFAPLVGLSVEDTVVIDVADFEADAGLADTGSMQGTGMGFGTQIGLNARGVILGKAAFNVSHWLTSTGLKAGSPLFRVRAALSGSGHTVMIRGVVFTRYGGLTVRGLAKMYGKPPLGVTAGLTAHGETKIRQHITPGPEIGLSVVGHPQMHGQAIFTGHPRLLIQIEHAIPIMSGDTTTGFTVLGKLRAQGLTMATSGSASFGPTLSLTVEGTADLTPIRAASFTAKAVLSADGFRPETPPVGITVKPVPTQDEPGWTEPSPPGQIWQVPE
jgi:hypothetical protein